MLRGQAVLRIKGGVWWPYSVLTVALLSWLRLIDSHVLLMTVAHLWSRKTMSHWPAGREDQQRQIHAVYVRKYRRFEESVFETSSESDLWSQDVQLSMTSCYGVRVLHCFDDAPSRNLALPVRHVEITADTSSYVRTEKEVDFYFTLLAQICATVINVCSVELLCDSTNPWITSCFLCSFIFIVVDSQSGDSDFQNWPSFLW